MNLQRRAFISALLFGLCVWQTSPSYAAEPGKSKTVRLLTVGNSFSRDAMTFLPDIVAADGNELILHQAVIGGSSPQQHLDKARLHESDAKDPAGLYATGKSLKEHLLAEPWDVITIQQASIKSHDAATYRPAAAELCEYIRRYAPNSEIVLHQTWAYRVDDPRFSIADPEPGEPRTQREMYEGLTRAYDEIAAELKVRVVPVGDAMFAADGDATWGYRHDKSFDPKKAKHPQLPDQTHSLHVGWRWSSTTATTKSARPTLRIDGHHASAAGQYLAGCVFYEFLYGTSVVGNKFMPPKLEEKYVRFLQETAHAAMAKRRGS